MMPVLTKQVGGLFMPWTTANEKAVAAGQDDFNVMLDGKAWAQKPQKYHARSLAMLRAKYAAVANKSELDMVLGEAGCLNGLRA